MNLSPSDWLENIISQLPALTLLQNMGYEYLTPQSALAKRGGKRSKIVLAGLRQKVARKKTQMYIQRVFNIVSPSFLIYLGFKHF